MPGMVVDEVLPAAAHLTGPGARTALGVAVAAAGGRLDRARPCYVHYRPGSRIVVRFDATVHWTEGAPVRETLLASTSAGPGLADTLRVTAEDGDAALDVDVWRWPFDPVLTGLADAVVPTGAARYLDPGAPPPALEVVAYRPTERAVVRCRCADGSVRYLKVVPPSTTAAVVARHDRLRSAGVPVPRVLDASVGDGVFVMAALDGPTVRDLIKSHRRPWPDASEYQALSRSLAEADLTPAPPVPSRVRDALGHAAMLSAVAPGCADRLERIVDVLRPACERAERRTPVTVHGDLYEAQLVVRHGRITGLLDVDDAGPGDPYGDAATVLAHLRFRARAGDRRRRVVDEYADELRTGLGRRLDPSELDVVTAAALVGLATGPFRIQQAGWVEAVDRHLAAVEGLLGTVATTG
jgi:aminoglycoside phosphotransferase (APT) family kinase protein